MNKRFLDESRFFGRIKVFWMNQDSGWIRVFWTNTSFPDESRFWTNEWIRDCRLRSKTKLSSTDTSKTIFFLFSFRPLHLSSSSTQKREPLTSLLSQNIPSQVVGLWRHLLLLLHFYLSLLPKEIRTHDLIIVGAQTFLLCRMYYEAMLNYLMPLFFC